MDGRKGNEARGQKELVGQGVQERAKAGPLIRGARDGPIQRVGDSRHEQDDHGVIETFVYQEPNVDGNQKNPEDGQTVGDIHGKGTSVCRSTSFKMIGAHCHPVNVLKSAWNLTYTDVDRSVRRGSMRRR